MIITKFFIARRLKEVGIVVTSITFVPFSAHRGRFEVIIISGESNHPAVLVCLMASPILSNYLQKKNKSSHTDTWKTLRSLLVMK